MKPQTTTTPRQYKDVTGNPVTLDWLVKNEPEWAANQIRHRDQLETELHSANEVASDNKDWFDELIDELSKILHCEQTPSAIVDKVSQLETELSEAKSQLSAMTKAAEGLSKSVKRNHEWHTEYNEDSDYSESGLCESNLQALAEFERVRKEINL